MQNNKTHIVVVGGGTGGMAVVSALSQLPNRDHFEITLVEPAEHQKGSSGPRGTMPVGLTVL